ncbi:GNAT family N-acetyltransferase [Pontibacter silvestris]|uniref:GNAT family N-acetyltransferase n=1 Tax=Pontibacter silvestris TaxID=2305183 RepID=A0ABW4X4N9_9BACT|nr:GNAT family N-acetyltransferase [Pontibacter silvestris]MCC9134880.1 GNAT family N-acetyltransferase [Pontibacter silvestris]
MIKLIRAESEQDLNAAFSVREKVFVQEQQVPRNAEYDSFEEIAKHYLATCEGVPCGAARWRITEHGIKLERFAVLQEYRNKNVGSLILQKVLKDVLATHADKNVYLHAQLPAVNFYKRHGFVAKGDMFSECDIQHYKMYYRG